MERPEFNEDSFDGDDQSNDVNNHIDESTYINDKEVTINIPGDNNVITIYI